MNNCTFVGRLVKDPVLRTYAYHAGQPDQKELAVTNFRIAVDNGIGEKKKTDFISVTAWRGAAEAIAKYMAKGRQIAVAGAVTLSSYDKDGKTYSTLAVERATAYEFLGQRIVQEDVPEDLDDPFPPEEDE